MLRKLIVIAGPTASGKTTLAITLANETGGQIISADSRQLYRFMDVGTAKPVPRERASVPHFGLDLLNPDQVFSAGAFSRYGREILERLWSRGILPIVVGGTGLYIKALLDGLWPQPASAQGVTAPVEAGQGLGVERMYAQLTELDPAAASRIRPTDAQRIKRALDLARQNLGGIATGWDPLPGPALAICLDPPREELTRRIDQRVETMVAQGLVGEVEFLQARGYGRSARAMQSLGYTELLDFRQGACTLEQALEKIKIRTRQYAKRQVTWFRADRRYRFLDLHRWGRAGAVERVLAQLGNYEGF